MIANDKKTLKVVREFNLALADYKPHIDSLEQSWKIACTAIAKVIVNDLDLPDNVEIITRWNSETQEYKIRTDNFIIRIRPNLYDCFVYCTSSGKNDNRGGIDHYAGNDDLDFRYQTMVKFCHDTCLVSESQLALF